MKKPAEGSKKAQAKTCKTMDNLNDTRKMENRSKQPNQDSLTWPTSSSN
jgi:hypothetical protein